MHHRGGGLFDKPLVSSRSRICGYRQRKKGHSPSYSRKNRGRGCSFFKNIRKGPPRRPFDAPPVLLYSFIEQTLQPGPAVSLKCSASGNPTPQIAWSLDGFPLPSHGR
ncbi:hypothetical protein NQ317_006678 [Molorchus minor]|uniref:Ig-like domain-containing protein n=1 Tax=Molorchus minor TaxID=1323400 RepID=A0ABQ9J9K0_9CUCU|nr:hypothetical protein NQ317_006678 [Molorchus minor]